MTKRFLLLPFLLVPALAVWGSNCDGSGNCYIRAAAAGTRDGSSWTNACSGFAGACAPSNMTRGVIYWVAAGSYSSATFNTAASGSTNITIRAAAPSNHGPAGDWNSGFAGLATISGVNYITTPYWIFDGQSRGADWRSGYNFHFINSTDGSNAPFVISAANLTFQYLDIQGTTNRTGPSYNDNGILATASANNLYVGYCYVHETGNTQFQLNYGTSNNATFEYNYIYLNHTGQNDTHDEAFSITYSNLIIRFNVMQDIMWTAFISDANCCTPNLSNWDIYGNVFYWDSAYASGSYTPFLGNGIVGLTGENWSGYLHF
ncbi:MAG: hypothetical protein ABI165_16410, partial [Bryobacteraceae bacterium]